MIRVLRIIHQNLIVYIYKKKKASKAKPAHDLLVSTVVFVSESYLFYDSCKCGVNESRNQQHHAYCLVRIRRVCQTLSMILK